MPIARCENPDCEQGREEGAETIEQLRVLVLQHHIRSGRESSLGNGKRGSIFHGCKRFEIRNDTDDAEAKASETWVFGHGVMSNGPFSTTGRR